jgi:catechol 2,3-dioxygenase-like lactoylglutathione lyase family enzyme
MSTPPLTTVTSLDHIVLTSRSLDATISFYTKYLGMTHTTFTPPSTRNITRHALTFGSQKINLHEAGKEFEPKAKTALPGTADLCFLVKEGTDLEKVIGGMKGEGVECEEGGLVVKRTGARGRLRSVYVRDPDGNLIE